MSSPVAPLTSSLAAHRTAVGQLLLASLCWSLGGLLIKAVDWPPLAVAGGRGLIAAVFLVGVSRGLRFTWSGPQLLGAVCYAATTVLFVTANKLTTAANAILLQYTAPVWIALFGAVFLRERASRADWCTIAAVFAGMALFFADGLDLSRGNVGDLVAIASGVAFAAMTLTLRHAGSAAGGGSAIEAIILGNLLAAVIGLPWMLTAPLPGATGLGALAILGVVQLGCSYWLYGRAIRQVTALEAVLIPVVEPLLNPVWVFLRQGERPAPLALAGGAVVLAAVTWRTLVRLREVHAMAAAEEMTLAKSGR